MQDRYIVGLLNDVVMSARVRALFPRLLGGWPYTRLPPAKGLLSQTFACITVLWSSPAKIKPCKTHRSIHQRSVTSFFIFYIIFHPLHGCPTVFTIALYVVFPSLSWCRTKDGRRPYLFGHRRVDAHRVSLCRTRFPQYLSCQRRVESITHAFSTL
ncbi:uncharacterized protein EDB91DRAFT_840780 [Suillus paluster]|uniref:uncharacterized protein n=1 Tax=Suillus paluster TaxID=48578 RepID=UPI001B8624C1|nr:uncharacterized protein EDB91DRAFT_840780 [Suillus paluster]KAG1728974.1 hypothetical protein EDB91DRAFT_840780 [Suillus paluster]